MTVDPLALINYLGYFIGAVFALAALKIARRALR